MSSTELLDRQKELRKSLADLVKESDEITDEVAKAGHTGDDGVHVNVAPAQLEAFRAKADEIRQVREILRGVDEMLGAKTYLDAPDGARTPVGAGAQQFWTPGKTIGQAFVESDEFKSLAGGRNGLTMPTPFSLNVSDLGSYAFGAKDVGGSTGDAFTDLPSGTPGTFGSTSRVPMVPRPHRTFRVRDLFPAVPTTATLIEYFRVSGFTNAASPVPERDSNHFGLKPRSSLAFVGEQAAVRTIAHWIGAHRTVLSDEPGLRNVIDSELLYGLQLVEDAQILNGAGTSQDLLGIMNVTGVQTQAQGSNTNADAIRKAITKIALAEYEATGIVMHPSNWEAIEIEREASNGQYINAIVSNIATGAEPRIWRLPIVVTQAITEDTALVGAFGIGATLYDREDATIRISENLDDWFVRNAVAILAEERLALTVQRPESFCKVTGLD